MSESPNFPYTEADYEAVPCNMCGSEDAEIVERTDRNGLAVKSVICKHCGLIYLSPRMTPPWYGKYYEIEYRRQMAEYKAKRSKRGRMPAAPKPANFQKMFERQHMRGQWLADFLQTHNVPNPKRIMDVGSSTGGVLRALAERFDAEVLGIEPSPDEAAFAEANKVPTDVGLFEDLSPQDRGKFDLILCTQSFNHLLDPRAVARKIRDSLHPHGTFFLECQDFFQVCQLRNSVPDAVQIDHVFMFVPATLKSTLQVAGFDIMPNTMLVDRFQSEAAITKQKASGIPSLHIRMLATPAAVQAPTSTYDGVNAELSSLRESFRHAPVRASKSKTKHTRHAGHRVKKVIGRLLKLGRPRTPLS